MKKYSFWFFAFWYRWRPALLQLFVVELRAFRFGAHSVVLTDFFSLFCIFMLKLPTFVRRHLVLPIQLLQVQRLQLCFIVFRSQEMYFNSSPHCAVLFIKVPTISSNYMEFEWNVLALRFFLFISVFFVRLTTKKLGREWERQSERKIKLNILLYSCPCEITHNSRCFIKWQKSDCLCCFFCLLFDRNQNRIILMTCQQIQRFVFIECTLYSR